MIKYIAPKSMSRIDSNRTIIIIICRTLVFSILLKLKIAPEMKKIANQNSKVLSILTSVNTNDNVFPVMMHLEIETPVR